MIKYTFHSPDEPRPTPEEMFFNMSKATSLRSPCLKRKVGAVIVKDGTILSTGYNGPARGEPHCIVCKRALADSGTNYTEKCPAVHAEENAVINAARQGVSILGGQIYVYAEGGAKPCYRCRRLIKNAGLTIIDETDIKESNSI